MKEQEAGFVTAEECRKHSISQTTFYKYEPYRSPSMVHNPNSNRGPNYGEQVTAIGAFVGGSSLWILPITYEQVRHRDRLGAGDIKLFAAAGAWTGLVGLPIVLLLPLVQGSSWSAGFRE